MAKEKFSVIAIEETSNWADGLLAQNGIEAAFGYYLIRHGEATHICSFTPSSWCVFIKNEFVYDSDNEAAHEFAGDNMYEGGSDDYFGFIDADKLDPRFIAETFTISVNSKQFNRTGGLKSDAYHDAIWKEAEEAAREFDCNGLEAPICGRATYAKYQAELTAKRRAENIKPLSGRDPLPLFCAAAKAEGIDTYEKAREAGYI